VGRPAEFCRDEAVTTAMHAFWTKGYDAVSVSELSQAMSITRSSFYNCFKTREALFKEAASLYVQSAPDYFLMSLDADADIVPAIRLALKNLCSERAADPDARGCMIINCLSRVTENDEAAPMLISMMQNKLAHYVTLLEKAIERGEIAKPYNAEMAAQAIMTHMIGINMMCKIVRSEEKLWQATEQFLESIGLKAG